MKKFLVAAAAALSMLVSACDGQGSQYAGQEDPCMTAANPQECSQFRDAGGDMQKYLVGGLAGAAAGYMLKSAMTPSGQRYYFDRDPSYHGTYARNSYYDRSYQTVTRRDYRPFSQTRGLNTAAYPTKRVTTTTTTTVKRRPFGGYKTKTTTTTTSSRGWGSSSSSRGWGSSSRSFGGRRR